MVKISQNMYRDLVHFVAVRPFEGKVQSASRHEESSASQYPWGLDLKQPSIKPEEGIKTEEEKSNVLVSRP